MASPESLPMFADEGGEIQDTLQGMTGTRTVPQVFIDGEFIGGCDGKPSLFSPRILEWSFS